MNIPNRITLYRFLAAFIFTFLMTFEGLFIRYIAILIFIAAAISDLYDGKIAREIGEVTNFGKIIDPLADKFLITSALFFLVQDAVIPAWMAIIIISREFAVMGLRILASLEHKIIDADKLGKYKTTTQLLSIIVIQVLQIFTKTFTYINKNNFDNMLTQHGGMQGKLILSIFPSIPYYLMLITVVITFISGLNYFIKNKNIFSKEF
ncbi:CDP-diacylglycerol--glycerol-3-phosphate 3-phosphatidyltransferase [Candidatus Desantisbacteria bacterium]|nr:CDP-diacylglycerol--glycerol-3-phosphate 3-phosphatidyltransferase [Candidatus Desantisbacteria bacterium]